MTSPHSDMKGFNHCLKYFQNEWAYGDVGDSEGFACNKRDYFKKCDFYINEQRHQEKLDDEKYRGRSKKFHTPKDLK